MAPSVVEPIFVLGDSPFAGNIGDTETVAWGAA